MSSIDPVSRPESEQMMEVYTLGRFWIKFGDKVISEEAIRSKKVWELFKYLLIHRDQDFLPEVIMENVWPEQDYKDPNLVIRSLIFRTRRFLEAELSPEMSSRIVFSQGCYRWKPGNSQCWVDVSEFAQLSEEGQKAYNSDPLAAIDKFQRAVFLYKGDFLPESLYKEWVMPLRSYYQRLFLDDILSLVRLLSDARRFPEAVETFEKAFRIEYYDEELHLLYLETLIKDGKFKKARAHYEEVTYNFYKEMGVKPSTALREIYRLINSEYDRVTLDLSSIQEGLKGRRESSGAFLCDAGVFQYLYQLERSRAERSGQTVYLGLLTFTLPDFSIPAPKLLDEAMAHLQEVLVSKLRKGDVVTRWSEAQFLLILPGLNLEQGEMVMSRLENGFKERYANPKLILVKKLQSMLPPEIFRADS